MENEKKLILGLDVSTTTIGCCLMLTDGVKKEIIKVTSVSPKVDKKIKGIESLFLKKEIFENEFISQYIDTHITNCVIEMPLLGSNNINTVGVLLQFNALISESIYKMLGIVPEYISSYDSRKFGIPSLMAKREFDKKGNKFTQAKINKSDPVLFGAYPFDVEKKNIVLEKISEMFPDIEWVFDKKGDLAKCSFDSSDAICCILGWLNKTEIEKNI